MVMRRQLNPVKAYSALHKLLHPFPRVKRFTVEVRDYAALKKALDWNRDPTLEEPFLFEYKTPADINERRLRDAEVVAGACCNEDPRTVLEIGTAGGQMTAVIAAHAPQAQVHTVNIPPEEIAAGGRLVTYAPAHEEIGHYYREQGHANVHQILANTATWKPDFGPIDVSFIDGCHDTKFVFNDTRMVLERCRPGSIIMWHDFCPQLAMVSPGKANVCAAVEKLFRKRMLRGPIFHLRDSWVGLMRVPEESAGIRP